MFWRNFFWIIKFFYCCLLKLIVMKQYTLLKVHCNFKLLENEISVKYKKWHVWQTSQIFVLLFQAKVQNKSEVKTVHLKDIQPYYIKLEWKLCTNLFQSYFYIPPFLNNVDFLKVSCWETPCTSRTDKVKEVRKSEIRQERQVRQVKKTS